MDFPLKDNYELYLIMIFNFTEIWIIKHSFHVYFFEGKYPVWSTAQEQAIPKMSTGYSLHC